MIEKEETMFEVGKRYEIRMLANGSEILMFATVEKYEHPLVKLNDVMGGDQGIPGDIVNVTSPNFISATLQTDSARPL